MDSLIRLVSKEEGVGVMVININSVAFIRTVRGKRTAFGPEPDYGEVHFVTGRTEQVYETAEEIKDKLPAC